MKNLTVALVIGLSALFAGQAEAGPYRKNNEQPAHLIGMKGKYCIYEIQTYGGMKYGQVLNTEGCYRELWSEHLGHVANLRLPYADRISHVAFIIDNNRNRQVPRSNAPRGSGVAALANLGKSDKAIAEEKRYNDRVKANREAELAAEAAYEAMNYYR